MMTAEQALARLRDGNARFVSGQTRYPQRRDPAEVAAEQHPFAVILGCSDSRVPAEIVFDQDLGDLFVIRIAGNIVAPSQIGSVEFAASQFGTRLVVVLGHSHCGAVAATLSALQNPAPAGSESLQFIIDRVRPAVAPLVQEDNGRDQEALMQASVRANVRASVKALGEGSPILQRLMAEEDLMIVGAEYSLETGKVGFFEPSGTG